MSTSSTTTPSLDVNLLVTRATLGYWSSVYGPASCVEFVQASDYDTLAESRKHAAREIVSYIGYFQGEREKVEALKESLKQMVWLVEGYVDTVPVDGYIDKAIKRANELINQK